MTASTLGLVAPGELRVLLTGVESIRLRRVRLTWALLLLNVLTFYPDWPLVVPIPATVGRLIAQGALVGALLVALSVNRPATIRPNVFLVLLTLLPVEALMTSFGAEFVLGAIFRAGRFGVFIVVLWLLTPWWQRRDLLLLKTHLALVWVVLGSVVLGLALAPSLALADDRLTGVVWPLPPTQVGHYAAVAIGLTVVLWVSGLMRRWPALAAIAIAATMLILTHTRTALVAMAAGIFVAGLSLFTTNARVRRVFAFGLVVMSIGALTVSSLVTTWLARGQDAQQLTALTGRTAVWRGAIAVPRSTFQAIFGFGLSNKSYNGLPIDSTWVATYQDQGFFGASVLAALLLFLLVLAAFRPRGPRRALALFLVAYCLVASFTETGLSDASLYVLELTLAASLLVPEATSGAPS